MSQATKGALLQAAKQLVGERGYAGTSVRDLAAASGANVAAVNYHFGSRDELLDRAVLESFLEWTDRVATAAQSQPGANPLARMAACAQATLDELPDAQAQFAAFLEALLRARRSPALRDELAAHYSEQRRRVGAILNAGDGAHQIPPETLEMLATFAIAAVDGLLVQSLLDPSAIPTGEQLGALAKAVFGAADEGQPPAQAS